jgi:hypothetical protein
MRCFSPIERTSSGLNGRVAHGVKLSAEPWTKNLRHIGAENKARALSLSLSDIEFT